MGSLLIRNVGRIATGDLGAPLADGTAIYCEDGVIREVGTTRRDVDVVLDANGLLAAPGLIDSHSHPSIGDYSPELASHGWMHAYLNGGVTTLVSAAELHVPGVRLSPPDPQTFKLLAMLGHRTWAARRPDGPRVVAGTLLLAPGLTEQDFDEVAAAGTRVAKFLFYPYEGHWDEARRYVTWCRERGMIAKMHSGGVSGNGTSVSAGAAEVTRLLPDVAAHINGGPIPMTGPDLERVVHETECYLELTPNTGNYRRSLETVELATAAGICDRLVIGTDTPSGTGVQPRAMLRNLTFLTVFGGFSPAEAIALASGNVARAHRIPGGLLEPGQPADIILLGEIGGSTATDALGALAAGDMPGVAAVVLDGQLVVYPRSDITPPPTRLTRLEKGSV